MKLSEHFTLEEFIATSQYRLQDVPAPSAQENMKRLCSLILEPLRQHLGYPLHVNSGYRSFMVNQAIGGAKGSAHLSGRAADITIPRADHEKAIAFLKTLKDLDALFVETKIVSKLTWFHIQIAKPGEVPRRIVKTLYV